MTAAPLTAAFHRQGRACEDLGSPFMGQLMGMLGDRLTPDDGAIAARLFAWEGDVSPAGASLPLRLAGGLHALVLQGHAELRAVYPPNQVSDDRLWQAVREALDTDYTFLDDWLASAPQTNELRRSIALRAVGQWLHHRFGYPLDMMELGASAGLNLNWDRFGLTLPGHRYGPDDAPFDLTPDWDGPMPPEGTPVVSARHGVDLRPLHPARDGLRLRAYLWPDQPDRLARMDAALALAPNPVDAGDAGDWITARLQRPTVPGTCRLIYHTVAWQYFPPDTDKTARMAIEAAGAAATDETPLAWFAMETDHTPPGARLTLRLWPGDLTLDAGRVDFHGRWMQWRLE
ncbi:hypothetical protein JANAI62_15270 [Jannaschia pagri]|uniref:DUF2332 domain-containing protein n=1 Tax=Jannaschia pagri TaxID=2829797 RepID=A0ABQ4NL28_9RHOB|nr:MULTISPECIES: DUF2332 family protein [unclassified Jannaschia]GIT91072.1 hypothetical protein JANAI61_15300 [Jannaschia sp. AI_61]GIT94904.1 hypothetical protein JANAI62_15270 [Jannaschia sp. AI_62]